MNENKISVRFWTENGEMCEKSYPIGTEKAVIQKDFEEFKKERMEQLLESLESMDWDFGYEEDTIINPQSNSGMTYKKVNKFYDSKVYRENTNEF